MPKIEPQPKQAEFLASPADVAIYGGGAGGGKSWSLLAEPLRHIKNPKFGAVIFRRDRQQITNQGGLWTESREIYPQFGGEPNKSDLYYDFPNLQFKRKPGARIGFAGLQYEDDVSKFQGSQIPLIGFDELTHFTEYQFFFMLSRNRSTSGVRGYVRATTNPDAESWVADLVAWYIDQKTGFPLPDRAGKLRYFTRQGDKIFWSDNRAELLQYLPKNLPRGFSPGDLIKSFTFIPADVFDNQILLENDPAYLANLLALPLIERERLLGGNWKIKPSAGKIFNRAWFNPVAFLADGGIEVRFWDFAATAKTIGSATSKKKNDPDFTATVKLRYKPELNRWTITDFFQIQAAPALVEKLFLQTTLIDVDEARRKRTQYRCRWEIEPGGASRRESYRLTTQLAGIDAKGVETGGLDKITRAKPFAVQAEHGNVDILIAEWNGELLTHLHGQPDLPHDDGMDAGAGAFNASLDGADETASGG